jgi:hypothetical protein
MQEIPALEPREMKNLKILAACLLISACAQTSVDNEDAAPRAEREYPTGSNIPRKHHETGDAQVYDRESVERAQQSSAGSGQTR